MDEELVFSHYSSLKSVFCSLVTPQHHCWLVSLAFRRSLLSSTRREIIFISDKHRRDVNYCNTSNINLKSPGRERTRNNQKIKTLWGQNEEFNFQRTISKDHFYNVVGFLKFLFYNDK